MLNVVGTKIRKAEFALTYFAESTTTTAAAASGKEECWRQWNENGVVNELVFRKLTLLRGKFKRCRLLLNSVETLCIERLTHWSAPLPPEGHFKSPQLVWVLKVRPDELQWRCRNSLLTVTLSFNPMNKHFLKEAGRSIRRCCTYHLAVLILV